jgi:hypothetical protein
LRARGLWKFRICQQRDLRSIGNDVPPSKPHSELSTQNPLQATARAWGPTPQIYLAIGAGPRQ